MNIISNILNEMQWYNDTKSILSGDIKNASVSLTGMGNIEKVHIMSGLAADFDAAVILVENDAKAREMLESYKFFNQDAVYFPGKDLIFYQADINGNQIITQRMQVLSKILSGEKITVITTFDALMSVMIPPEELFSNRILIEQNAIIEERALSIKLTGMGYTRSAIVSMPGEFSIRGGIIDIFDLTKENPVRIELWGDQVESIRVFDVQSQRSIENVDKICILPASELILSSSKKEEGFHKMQLDADKLIQTFKENNENERAFRVKEHLEKLRVQLLETDMGMNLESYIHYFYEKTGSFLDLLTKQNTCVLISEPLKVLENAKFVQMEFEEGMKGRMEKGYLLPEQARVLNPLETIVARIQRGRFVAFSGIIEDTKVFEYNKHFLVSSCSIASFNGSFKLLTDELRKKKKAGNKIIIVSPSRTRAKRLAEDLCEEEVYAAYTEDEDKELQKGEIFTIYGHLKSGFEYPEIGYTIISEDDIFGKEKVRKKKKPKFGGGKKIAGYGELKIGDYVIHENHGLGIYRGIEKVEVEHITKDYMKIEYKDGGNLYVLASNFDAVQLFADAAAKPPKLNKLGTNEWNKTKSKVKMAVEEVAKELVELYAIRSQRIGYRYEPDTVWQKEFEELFPFEETLDQLSAIEATKDDMESDKIMDRLVCGDVGFGKTEVAIRAAFKAVQDGKQVAYLVPTTILAQQHYNTFAERMQNFPVKVGMLSRFCTTKEIKRNIEELKKGTLDIVIGTHRMLSKDVVFKDLGLLIIDEEQRFGVTHKEKIKTIKENVDVLTLTATPIPRTLHMSLIGIRDMSLLEEPPMDRLPIQTYVMEYNEEMVREAILRELNRDGQVYYVYNRVNDIDLITANLQRLLPDARIAFAHGQMKESELEVIMMEFVNHEIDVLVSTTIIETGLDIPNVNTMIIHDSDSMGLSQLYQLRGRVGRSNRTSFAFLMYQKNKMLKEVAEKRLAAIKEFTDLGSGFKIAMRDLEIRGAGNLLGRAQHGHIEAVGYDLYCKMLEEAVATEQGKEVVIQNQCSVELNVDAFIPAEYIVNEAQKLDMYKRMASVENKNDYDDMTDEMKDRFGEVPVEADNLLRIALIKHKATLLHINELKGRAGRIKCVMNKKAPVVIEQIPVFLNEYAGRMKFTHSGDPTFILSYDIVGLVERDELLLLEKTEELLETMNMLYIKDSVNDNKKGD